MLPKGSLPGLFVLGVPDFHLLHGGPHIGEELLVLLRCDLHPRLFDVLQHGLEQTVGDVGGNPGRDLVVVRVGVVELERVEEELVGDVEGDVRGKHTAPYKFVLPDVKFTSNRLVISVEAPRELVPEEPRLDLGENRAVGHAFDAGPLVSLGDLPSDKGEGNHVEIVSQHLVDVVDKLPRDRILVPYKALIQVNHRPFRRGVVEGGETGPEAQALLVEGSRGGREDGGFFIVAQYKLLESDQVLECRWEGFPHRKAGQAPRGGNLRREGVESSSRHRIGKGQRDGPRLWPWEGTSSSMPLWAAMEAPSCRNQAWSPVFLSCARRHSLASAVRKPCSQASIAYIPAARCVNIFAQEEGDLRFGRAEGQGTSISPAAIFFESVGQSRQKSGEMHLRDANRQRTLWTSPPRCRDSMGGDRLAWWGRGLTDSV